MNKRKAGLVAVGGAAVGVVTFRKLRNRRSEETPEEKVTDQVEEAEEDVKEAKGEAVTAIKHVGGAVKHVALAVKKTITSPRKKTEAADTEEGN